MSGVRAPRKAKRTRAIIHGSGGSGRASGHAKIVTFTPAKTRRGRTIYEEVTDWRYYRASSSEEDETPTRKKIKSLRHSDLQSVSQPSQLSQSGVQLLSQLSHQVTQSVRSAVTQSIKSAQSVRSSVGQSLKSPSHLSQSDIQFLSQPSHSVSQAFSYSVNQVNPVSQVFSWSVTQVTCHGSTGSPSALSEEDSKGGHDGSRGEQGSSQRY